MRRLQVLWRVLTLTIAAALVSACVVDTAMASNNNRTVALVMKALTNPFFGKMERGAKRWAQNNNIPLESFGIQNPTDVALQISIVENLILRNYGAIVIAPADSDQLIPVCQKAMENKITVINIDNPLNREKLAAQNLVIPFAGPSNLEGGRLVGNYIKSRLKAEGNVIIIEGIRGVENSDLRVRGLSESVTRNSRIKILASVPADWDTDQAFSVTMKLLETFKDVDAVLCANDLMAIGALQAIEMTGRKGILVTGYDNLEQVRAAVRDSRIHATVEQHPELMGAWGVDMAVNGIKGRSVTARRDTPLDLITPEPFSKSVGLSVSNLDNPFFSSVVEGAKRAAALYGITLDVKNASDDAGRQFMDIVAFSNTPVDAVIINPTSGSALLPAVEKIQARDIPIVTVDRRIDKADVLCHVASDNIQGGIMAARVIARQLGNQGRVVEIEGIPGTSAAFERGLGFNTELKKYPDIRIVAREGGNFNRGQAADAIRRILAKGQAFQGVFAHNDAMILGVMDVLEQSFDTGPRILVGFDAIKEARDAVQKGRITATIAQQPETMGWLSVEAAVGVFTGARVSANMMVPLTLISQPDHREGPIVQNN